jgi:hypothetical protein
MRVPQVSDRIKEAPAVALRGVLAGMGQLLLIADRLRNKTGAGEEAPQAQPSEPAETATNSTETAAAPVPAASAAAAAPPAAAPAAAATPAAEAPAAETPEPETPEPETPAAEAPAPKRRDYNKTGNVRLLTDEDTESEKAASPVASEAPADPQAGLPLPNYDDLSVASLRARLRTLTSAQVAELAEYERTHAARAEVITMFERRIAKLEAGG